MVGVDRVPQEYIISPPWPSLYWPFGPGYNPLNQVTDISHTLYYLNDIWRYTVVWSVFFALIVYIPAGFLACFNLAKSRTLRWYILLFIPLIFICGGVLASFIIGSIIGVILSYVYSTGYFVMTTWIPFLWALIHILVVIISAYSTITILL
ncbi:unnamed protein product [Cunninghamella blakesleeana]